MIKVIELRKAINTLLKTTHPRVYYKKAPEDAPYPYVVFRLVNSRTESSLEQFNLEVTTWDNQTNTTIIETLMDNVKKALNKTSVIIEGLGFTLHYEGMFDVEDNEERLNGRMHTYQVRTYEGG